MVLLHDAAEGERSAEARAAGQRPAPGEGQRSYAGSNQRSVAAAGGRAPHETGGSPNPKHLKESLYLLIKLCTFSILVRTRRIPIEMFPAQFKDQGIEIFI